MPELPDVEIERRYLDSTGLRREISEVEVPRKKVLRDISAAKLRDELVGTELTESSRRGKHLLAKSSGGKWLTLHFGMTGFLKYHKGEKPETDHPAVVLHYDNGYLLIYDCTRLFGEVGLTGSAEEFYARRELGPDALDVPEGEFRNILGGRRGGIKSALMNQKLVAGIGNIYSDEMLHSARIHPASRASRIPRKRVDKLHGSMTEVLGAAISAKAKAENMPKNWIIRNREEGASCPCGGEIRKETIAGRPSYFCPECQERFE